MGSSRSQFVPALRKAWRHMQQEAALAETLPDEGNPLISRLLSALAATRSSSPPCWRRRNPFAWCGRSIARRAPSVSAAPTTTWTRGAPSGSRPSQAGPCTPTLTKSSGRSRRPLTPCCRSLRFSHSLGSSSRSLRWPAGSTRPWTTPTHGLGSVVGEGDAHYSRPHNSSILSNITKLGTELGVTCEKEITGAGRFVSSCLRTGARRPLTAGSRLTSPRGMRTENGQRSSLPRGMSSSASIQASATVMGLLAPRLSRSGPSSSVASPSPSSTLSTSPTTEQERAMFVAMLQGWQRTGISPRDANDKMSAAVLNNRCRANMMVLERTSLCRPLQWSRRRVARQGHMS